MAANRVAGGSGHCRGICRIVAAQRRADVRNGFAQRQSLDEKRRDGASFGQVWEALLTPSRQTSRAKLTDPL